MMNKFTLLLISCLVILTGCSAIETERPVNYYVLDARPIGLIKKDIQHEFLVSRVQLPDYLNQPNIVLKDDSQRLHVAFYHSWADDLASTIRRVVVSELNSAKNNASFSVDCENCDAVDIRLDHFYPTTEGDVILSGSYEINRKAQQKVSKNFFVEVVLEEDGYEHAVKMMRSALIKLTAQINEDI